jgi:pyridoxine kinase
MATALGRRQLRRSWNPDQDDIQMLYSPTKRAFDGGWQDGAMTSVSVDAPQSAAAPAVVLTIAGSEATGGAGAQADLKTFQELGVFGIANLTCIVSFNPNDQWNHRFVPVDQQVIADQLEATTAAYGPAPDGEFVPGRPVLDTVKIGMLGSPATIATVADALEANSFSNVVLDPVLICKGQEPGHALDTDQALKAQILPLATFVTPNHFEAESLSGLEITDVESLKAAAIRIHEISGAAVLAKGGVRLEGPDAVDVFYDGETLEVLSAPKVGEVAVSGAGCSLAAAVTAELAKGATPLDAARTAKDFVTAGIRNRVASGAPFDALWQGGAR